METDRLLADDDRRSSSYQISRWFYLQLVPLGIIGWKGGAENGGKLVYANGVNGTRDIEDHSSTKPANMRTTLLDDTYRLRHQTFDLSSVRRRYYFIFSTVFLTFVVVATMFLFFCNIIFYFGQTRHIIHFISMATNSVNLLLLPAGCALSRIYFYFIGKANISTLDCCSIAWCLWMFLEESFVFRRLRFLPLTANKKPYPFSSFLVVSFAACVVTGYLSFVVYYRSLDDAGEAPEECRANVGYFPVILLAETVGAIFFALFSNYVNLLRTSLREELIFLIKYCYCNEGDIESCRRRIVSMVRDYRVIRSVTNLWMQVVLPASVLGLVVHLKWNYMVFTWDAKNSKTVGDDTRDQVTDLIFMSVYIFLCKLLVTCLPLLALGGTDLQYMWNEMRLTLSLIQQSHAEKFWKETLKFVQKLNPHGTEEWVASVALSVIGVYLGLKVGTQDFNYYCA